MAGRVNKAQPVNDGDWICSDSSCGNINYAFRKVCNKCGRDKGKVQYFKKKGTEIGKQAASKSGGLFSADDWQCSKCGNVNWARRSDCNVCGEPKFGTVEPRTGLGGGYNEREGVEYIDREESDEEYDDFGRLKKKKGASVKTEETKPKEDKISKTSTIYQADTEEDLEEEDDDDDDDVDLSKYELMEGSEDGDAAVTTDKTVTTESDGTDMDLSKYPLQPDHKNSIKASESRRRRPSSRSQSSRSRSPRSKRSRSRSKDRSRRRTRSRSASPRRKRSSRSSRSRSRGRYQSSSSDDKRKRRSRSSSPRRRRRRSYSSSRSTSRERKSRYRSRSSSRDGRRHKRSDDYSRSRSRDRWRKRSNSRERKKSYRSRSRERYR